MTKPEVGQVWRARDQTAKYIARLGNQGAIYTLEYPLQVGAIPKLVSAAAWTIWVRDSNAACALVPHGPRR